MWTRLPAHSCGGSCGFGTNALRTAFPFHPLARDRRCSSDRFRRAGLSICRAQFVQPDVPCMAERSEAHARSRRRPFGQEPLCGRLDHGCCRRPGSMSRPPRRATTRWRRASPRIARAAARSGAPSRRRAISPQRSQHAATAPVLVDCLTLWLSNLHARGRRYRRRDRATGSRRWPRATAPVVLVANEVGSGIVPDNALGRRFRDLQGVLNQRIAARADRVVLDGRRACRWS